MPRIYKDKELKMGKSTSSLFVTFVASLILTTTVMADAAKGQKYYLKNLKECQKDGLKNGANFAAKNDRDTWTDLKTNNKLVEQWKEICPSGAKKIEKMKAKEMEDLFDFCWQYASDGDVPSCG